jgi:hypothetical protein
VQGEAPSYDLNTAANHDYFVAKKAFFFDLSVSNGGSCFPTSSLVCTLLTHRASGLNDL